jgi:hypothetical protein
MSLNCHALMTKDFKVGGITSFAKPAKKKNRYFFLLFWNRIFDYLEKNVLIIYLDK